MRHLPVRCGRIRAMFAAAALAAPLSLFAQSVDSTMFRAGQWGTEFTLGGSYTELGVLRFSSPSRAWIASLGGRIEQTDVDTDGFGMALSAVNVRVGDVRVGHRWYRAIVERVQQYATAGVLASATRVERDTEADLSYPLQTSTRGGAFADIGAIWMVTPRLSLGAAWNASVIRSRTRIEGNGPQAGTSTMTTFRFGDLRVQGALYF